MFKTIVTLFRARAVLADERLRDAHALTLLDQQIRDCATLASRAKKAAALAVARQRQEQRRVDALQAQIADLESRARAALQQGRDDLALETAGILADLEADRDAAACACALLETEGAKLRARLHRAESRLSALHRGRDLARARDALGALPRELQDETPFHAGFAQAEATLARLHARKKLAEDAQEALTGFDDARSPAKMAEKLAQNGCGPRLRATAEDVFARLRAQAAA